MIKKISKIGKWKLLRHHLPPVISVTGDKRYLRQCCCCLDSKLFYYLNTYRWIWLQYYRMDRLMSLVYLVNPRHTYLLPHTHTGGGPERGGQRSVCDFVARWEGALVKVEHIACAWLQVFSRTVLQESSDLRAYLHMLLVPNYTCTYMCVRLWICIHLTHTQTLTFSLSTLPSFFTYLILSTV